jgi:hypothetical protein
MLFVIRSYVGQKRGVSSSGMPAAVHSDLQLGYTRPASIAIRCLRFALNTRLPILILNSIAGAVT